MRNYSKSRRNASIFKRRLRRRIQENNCQQKSTLTVKELAAHIHCKYREYNRIQIEPFTKMVEQNLDSQNIIIKNNGKTMLKVEGDDDDDDMTSNTDVSNKSKENDSLMSESEENTSGVSKIGDDNQYKMKVDIKKPTIVEVEVVTNSSNKTSEKMKKPKLNDDEQDKIMLDDLGGIDDLLDKLEKQVIVPLFQPKLDQHYGVKPVSGILLHGPPGCGKTSLALAIANETDVPFFKISATELVSGVSGASEENIRELFLKAYESAPSIVFIDEIDAIATKRENQHREMEKRIVTQLMTCMDESHRPKNGKRVLVIGATNRPDAIDPALRRAGRFDREFLLGLPNEDARTKILSALTRKVKVKGALDLVKIARETSGFVGADLKDLVNTAGYVAKERFLIRKKSEISEITEGRFGWLKKEWNLEEIEKDGITMSDFEAAAKMVQPSLTREGFSSIPNVKWEDVGGYDELKTEFYRHIIRPIKYPDAHKRYSKVKRETGFLLYGPPGCGKTLIAKAVANEAKANFKHIQGCELLNKYVGESESAIRKLFISARMCAPCVVFIDEIEGLTTQRGNDGGWVVERLLNQLLIELSGGDNNEGVYVIGATNRPDVMDNASIRSGRLGNRLYVPLPTPDERGSILKALAATMQLDTDADLIAIGKSDDCHNFSGADLSKLIYEAFMVATDEAITKFEFSESSLRDMPIVIKDRHFCQVVGHIMPISDEEIQNYTSLQKKFSPKHCT